MDKDVEYEIALVKEQLERKLHQLEEELRRVVNRKADKKHEH